MNTFQYLLRHSFWRPRDILFLAGRLITVAEHYKKRNLEFTQQTVKLIVSRSLHSIIDFEFIKEFSGSIENIAGVIGRFHGCPQVMSFDQFFKALEGIRPALPIPVDGDVAPPSSDSDQDRILRLLYGIGFVGFYLNGKSAVNQQFQTQWVFVFNEGDTILDMLSQRNRAQMQLVIHPIFIEYLGLTPYRDALVCEFSDAYLAEQEAHADIT